MPAWLKLCEILLHNIPGPQDELGRNLLWLQAPLSFDVEGCRIDHHLVQQRLSQDAVEGCSHVLRTSQAALRTVKAAWILAIPSSGEGCG